MSPNPDPANPRQPDPPTATPAEKPAAGADLAAELGIEGAGTVADLAKGFRPPRPTTDKEETVALRRTSAASKFGPTTYPPKTDGHRRTKDECIEDAITALDIGKTTTAMQLLHQAGKSVKEAREFIADYHRSVSEGLVESQTRSDKKPQNGGMLDIFESAMDPLHPTVLQAATITADFLEDTANDHAKRTYFGYPDSAHDLLTSFLVLTARGYNPLKVLQRMLDDYESIPGPRSKVVKSSLSIEHSVTCVDTRNALTPQTRTLMKDIITHARNA